MNFAVPYTELFLRQYFEARKTELELERRRGYLCKMMHLKRNLSMDSIENAAKKRGLLIGVKK